MRFQRLCVLWGRQDFVALEVVGVLTQPIPFIIFRGLGWGLQVPGFASRLSSCFWAVLMG